MSDEIFLDGKTYLSSKRAAKETGYVQDYIGQLARKGLIDAQRVGGLWYIFPASLEAYKRNAEAFTPQPPTQQAPQGSDTIVSFDGKDYVTAAKAAKITGYNPDYVGQLARGGKILSRQVGNRWYVEREGLLAHKAEKDRLLATVQAESAGLVRPGSVQSQISSSHSQSVTTPPVPLPTSRPSSGPAYAAPLAVPVPTSAHYEYDESSQLRYIREEEPLFPALEKPVEDPQETEKEVGIGLSGESRQESHEIPIRVVPRDLLKNTPMSPRVGVSPRSPERGRSRALAHTVKGVAALTVVIVLSYGFVSVKSGGTYAALVPQETSSSYQRVAASASVAVSALGDLLESWVSQELRYFRAE